VVSNFKVPSRSVVMPRSENILTADPPDAAEPDIAERRAVSALSSVRVDANGPNTF
jgi:hypothetical protein